MIQALINILNIDILMIQAVMKGSTAARKGLKRGDQVESLLHLLPSIMIRSLIFESCHQWIMIRSWMWTGRASNMWWPWSGLLKSSPNRHFSRSTNRHNRRKNRLTSRQTNKPADKQTRLRLFLSHMYQWIGECLLNAHSSVLCQVNVKSNFLAFKEANNLSSDRKKEQEQGESSNSLSPAMANMSLQPGLPVAGLSCYHFFPSAE